MTEADDEGFTEGRPDGARWRRSAGAILVAILLGASAALPASGRVAAESAVRAMPALHVLESSPGGLWVQVAVPAIERRAATIDGVRYAELHLDGYARLEAAGWPAVPLRSFLVAVPPGMNAEVAAVDVAPLAVTGLQVAPAPETALVNYEYDDPAAMPTFRTRQRPATTAYAQDALYPASPVTLEQPTTIRGLRVVPVTVYPIQVNSARGMALLHERLSFRLTFVPDELPAPTVSPRAESPAFADLLDRQILNSADASRWPQAAPAQSAPPPAPSPCLDGNAFRLTVSQSGIYRLTQASLATAGLPASVPGNTLRLCQGASEIAVKVSDGDSDGQFEAGDHILFYGDALRTQETATNVYWLTYGGAAGLRIGQAAGNPSGDTTPSFYDATLRVESDQKYYSLIPKADVNDHWYYPVILSDTGISQPNPSLTLPFELDSLAPGQWPVPVRVEVWGFNTFEHHNFQVELNNVLVDSASFIGSGAEGANLLFNRPSDSLILVPGTNNLKVKAVQNTNGSHHAMLVNWAEMTVRRQFVAQDDRLAFAYGTPGSWNFQASGFSDTATIFDVSNPAQPVEVTTTTSGPGTVAFSRTTTSSSRFTMATAGAFLTPASLVKDTPSNLGATGVVADYVIVTDPTLTAALQPLISARVADGHAVQTAYVQDIFDEFSYGIYDPEAIKDFLHHVYDYWSGSGGPNAPRPTFALLAGEGSYDHRNVLGLNGANGNRVPIYLLSGIDSNLGESGADNQYVDFNEDNLADMLLGRIPAATPAELTTVIDKILAYEAAPPEPSWQKQSLFLVDNGFLKPDCVEDPAGDFYWHVENFLDGYFPSARQYLRRVYYAPDPCYPRTEYPTYEYHYVPAITEATLRLMQYLNAGNQFISYIGHSSIVEWGFEDYLTMDLVSQLSNGDRTPIELPMTCLTGFYHQPQGNSLSEALLEHVGGGTVASYTPTGLQVQHGHDLLLQGFFNAAYVDEVSLLGQAVYGAKLRLAGNDPLSQYQDLQDTFMLLGDPAMKLNLCADCFQAFVPASIRQ